jgi:hypothetical protein
MHSTAEINQVTLYGLVRELDDLENAMNSDAPEDVERCQNLVSELLKTKLDNCVGYDSYLGDTTDAIDKRIEELKEAKKVIENRRERFRQYMIFCIESLGVQEVKGKLYSIKARKPSKLVDVCDEKMLPPKFVRIEMITKVMKSEIADAIKNGEQVPGAQLIDGKKSLTISVSK